MQESISGPDWAEMMPGGGGKPLKKNWQSEWRNGRRSTKKVYLGGGEKLTFSWACPHRREGLALDVWLINLGLAWSRSQGHGCLPKKQA